MSDPLQPSERDQRRTPACLELLAQARYPFVLSTKSTLAVQPPWRDALARCNVVVQVSMVSPAYDTLERGAPPFAERMKMLSELTALVPRVVIRVQPYTPDVCGDVLRALPRYARSGVHGVIVQGLKRKHAAPGTVKAGGDWCLPPDRLEPDFARIRERCQALGLRFYCAENRLRRLSDHRSCCGVDGLPGFRPNLSNLNTLVFGGPLRYRRRMHEPSTAWPFKALAQSPAASVGLRGLSFADAMQLAAGVPTYRRALGLPEGRLRASSPLRSPLADSITAGCAARRNRAR